MITQNDDKSRTRRPLMFQVDSINEEKRILERSKMLVENPVGGAFKVSNGKYLCEIVLSECGVSVKCKDRAGRIETLSTKIQ